LFYSAWFLLPDANTLGFGELPSEPYCFSYVHAVSLKHCVKRSFALLDIEMLSPHFHDQLALLRNKLLASFGMPLSLSKMRCK